MLENAKMRSENVLSNCTGMQSPLKGVSITTTPCACNKNKIITECI